MSVCSFLLDECLPAPLLRALSRPGVALDVAQVGDLGIPPKGTDDDQLLLFCEKHEQIFVTGDRGTLPGHLAAHYAGGRSTWGVFTIAPGKPWRLVYDDLFPDRELHICRRMD